MHLTIRSGGPHQGQPVVAAGAPLGQGGTVGVLVHGRGATAEGMIELGAAIASEGVTWLAPQASGYTWYPQRFLAPLAANEPWLSSALDAVGDVVAQAEASGAVRSRIVLIGFSQGACLALEWLIRSASRVGGVAALSGGLIGPPGTVWPDNGPLNGVAAFLGCSDMDDHIPKERVLESEAVLRSRGADVTTVLYPGMEHTVSPDEVKRVRSMIAGLR